LAEVDSLFFCGGPVFFISISDCRCACVAGDVSSSQKPYPSTPVSHVTMREIEAMTDRSAAVKQLFRADATDSHVSSMLIRTGKVLFMMTLTAPPVAQHFVTGSQLKKFMGDY